MSKRPWTMTPEHAAHAAANPPREGYSCHAGAETHGGGCFNCGWKPVDVMLARRMDYFHDLWAECSER